MNTFTDELENGDINLSAYELHRLIKIAQNLLAQKDAKTNAQIKAKIIYAKIGQTGKSLTKVTKAPKLSNLQISQIRALEAIIAEQQAIIDKLSGSI